MRLAALLLFPALLAGQTKSDWIQLFNGKDLTGWTAKIRGHAPGENWGNTFRVRDGKLTVAYDAYPEFKETFGHLFYRDKFSHYRVAVEYRFVGEQARGGPGWAWRNSGIMVHSQAPESMTVPQDFPISIEVQLLGGKETGERTTANLCTPGTHVVRNGELWTTHCLNSSSDTFRGDQWVRVEVEVLGSEKIRHFVNGKLVLEYEKPQIGGTVVSGHNPEVKKDGQLLEEGYISLQSESHPIEFRKVELLNLSGCMDPKAKNYKKHFVHRNDAQCKF
jgi:hypothetical protein